MMESILNKNRRQSITILQNGDIIHTDNWQKSGSISTLDAAPVARHQSTLKLTDYGLLHGEEYEVSQGGATAAFYIHGCPLRCKQCYQPEFFGDNANIELDIATAVKLALTFQSRGANSLSIVVGTIQKPVMLFLQALKNHPEFHLPVVYNYSGFLNTRSLNSLLPLVDTFVPDFKALSEDARQFIGLQPSYTQKTQEGIEFLVRNKPKSILIRHLIVQTYSNWKQECLEILNRMSQLGTQCKVSFLTAFKDPKTNQVFVLSQKNRRWLKNEAVKRGVSICL